MKNLTKHLCWDEKKSVNSLRLILENNGLIVSSTDTILGFLAKLSQKSFDHLSKIKGRDGEKNYLIVSRDLNTSLSFVQKESISKNVLRMLAQCWPGPVTVIFKAKTELPRYVQSPTGKIAIRCPKHDGLQRILRYFDGLFSTSVNKSGKPAAQIIETIDCDLLADISCIVTDNDIAKVLPSTIIDVSNESTIGIITVVREGAYPIADLERLYGAPFSY